MSAQAQTDTKFDQNVKKQIENINVKLSSVDPKLAMTEAQVTSAKVVFLQAEKDMAEARKTVSTDEEKKAVQKPIRQKAQKAVRTEILTKEQRQALNSLNKEKE